MQLNIWTVTFCGYKIDACIFSRTNNYLDGIVVSVAAAASTAVAATSETGAAFTAAAADYDDDDNDAKADQARY